MMCDPCNPIAGQLCDQCGNIYEFDICVTFFTAQQVWMSCPGCLVAQNRLYHRHYFHSWIITLTTHNNCWKYTFDECRIRRKIFHYEDTWNLYDKWLSIWDMYTFACSIRFHIIIELYGRRGFQVNPGWNPILETRGSLNLWKVPFGVDTNPWFYIFVSSYSRRSVIF